MARTEVKRVSVGEFMEFPLPKGGAELLDRFNGGSFMACHVKVFEAYGIWVEELTPVFRKFDAMVALRDLPEALR